MALTWDKAQYDSAYRSGGLHYDRRWLFDTDSRQSADNIETIFGPLAGLRIVVVGSGFGWSVEHLVGRGYNAIGVDTSPYIQAEKQDTDLGGGTYTQAVILDEDSSTGASRGRVRQALGGWPDLVVTEDIFGSFTDTELLVGLDHIDSYRDPKVVAHLVTPLVAKAALRFPTWNWKPSVDWRAFLDDNGYSHHRLFSPGSTWREWI